jgi:hypothetical protein
MGKREEKIQSFLRLLCSLLIEIRSPVSVGFPSSFLDFVKEETGDQNDQNDRS